MSGSGDILIRGMEMPTSCEDCPMCHSNAEYDYAYCCVSSAETSGNKIPSNCPLVPVPPHGRLIDADAEVARVQNLYNKAVAKDPEMGCVSVYEGEIAVLKLAPTIIPAEEAKE